MKNTGSFQNVHWIGYKRDGIEIIASRIYGNTHTIHVPPIILCHFSIYIFSVTRNKQKALHMYTTHRGQRSGVIHTAIAWLSCTYNESVIWLGIDSKRRHHTSIKDFHSYGDRIITSLCKNQNNNGNVTIPVKREREVCIYIFRNSPTLGFLSVWWEVRVSGWSVSLCAAERDSHL